MRCKAPGALAVALVLAAAPAAATPAAAETPPGRDRYIAACMAALPAPSREQARRFCRCLWRYGVEAEGAGLDPDRNALLLLRRTQPAPTPPPVSRPQADRLAEEHLAIVNAVCTEAAVMNILDADGQPSD